MVSDVYFFAGVGARPFYFFFFFNDTATTEIYTLSLHDALPIYHKRQAKRRSASMDFEYSPKTKDRSEEHTSELQSPCNLVCRLLLEKKKTIRTIRTHTKLNPTLHTLPLRFNTPAQLPCRYSTTT